VGWRGARSCFLQAASCQLPNQGCTLPHARTPHPRCVPHFHPPNASLPSNSFPTHLPTHLQGCRLKPHEQGVAVASLLGDVHGLHLRGYLHNDLKGPTISCGEERQGGANGQADRLRRLHRPAPREYVLRGDRATVQEVRLGKRLWYACIVRIGPLRMGIMATDPVVATGFVLRTVCLLEDRAAAFFGTTGAGPARTELLRRMLQPLKVRQGVGERLDLIEVFGTEHGA
jgi:hypothetical protein